MPHPWNPAPALKASFALHGAAALGMLAIPGVWPWALGALAANHAVLTVAGLLVVIAMVIVGFVPETRKALLEVPYRKGVNNHMGSRFTADRDLMRVLLKPVKDRGLFFVDSRTTAKTVALDEARIDGDDAGEVDASLLGRLDGAEAQAPHLGLPFDPPQ